MATQYKASLFKEMDHKNCIQRIQEIESDSKPLWGVMTAAQMFAHCYEVNAVGIGQKDFKANGFLRLLRPIIKIGVFGQKPYKKSTRTAPQYIVSDQRDFEEEKRLLLKSLDDIYSTSEQKQEDLHHPFFGRVTADELGWALYKHLDHHLQQFGV